MAKRYIRVNWQNRPSVATPISATNLNKMDKGIDDIDNAIEEIYNKRVNNVVTTNPDTFLAGPVGKTLQDQITTLNNNLTNKEMFQNVNTGVALPLAPGNSFVFSIPRQNAFLILTAEIGLVTSRIYSISRVVSDIALISEHNSANISNYKWSVDFAQDGENIAVTVKNESNFPYNMSRFKALRVQTI